MGEIAFISELPFSGKVSRDHPHMRTEFAQFCALKADHFCFYDLEKLTDNYKHIILLISKTDKLRDYLYSKSNIITSIKQKAGKLWFMQESTAQIYQTKDLHLQIWHYNLLQEVDGILTENTTDFKYFKGLVGEEKIIETIPTLIIEDLLIQYRNNKREERVMVGGNFNSWYAGFDSYITASEFELPISIPKMRNVSNEEQLVEVLPHVTFTEWMAILSKYKYAVHLMPNITAGTFALNCSFFGIPCIGYEESDTQRLCQPQLSVSKYDLHSARNLAKQLKNDKSFYEECSNQALANYEKFFNETVFLEKMKTLLK